MKLKSITLENTGLHRHLHVDFEDGLIGIFGPQGSGKSTLMRAAFAALTNDYTRLADTKDAVVCQHMQPGEYSRQTLIAEHMGNEFTLQRTLAPSTRHYLKLADGREFKKDAEVRRELEAILGSSRNILGTHVFVDQWDLRKLFIQTDTERATTLSQLCGTQYIAACEKSVLQQRDVDFQLLNMGTEDVDRLRRELGEYQATAKKEDATCKRLIGDLLSSEEVQASQEAVDKQRQHVKLKEELAAAVKQLAETKQQVATAWETSAAADGKLEKLEQREREVRRRLTAAEQAEALYDAKLERFQSKQLLEQRVVNLELLLKRKPPVIGPGLHETVDEITAKLEQVMLDMFPHETIITQFNKLGSATKCPTCQQPLDNIQQRVQAARAALAPLQTKYLALKVLKSNRAAWDKSAAEFLRDQTAHAADQLRVLEELKKFPDVEAPEAPEVNAELLADALELVVAEREAATKVHQQAIRDSSRLSANLVTLEKSRDDIEGKLEGSVLTEEECQAIIQLLETNNLVSHELSAARARRDEYTKLAKDREDAIARAERVREQSEKAQEWVTLLARVASVLNRNSLPFEVHRRALRRMEAGTNAMLAQFESTFRVTTADDLSYRCNFFDGTVMSDRRLSGGQQVVLALSFRRTLNSLFAGQIGMLVLDEPTAGLDPRHIPLLEQTLARLSEDAKNRGYQVFIITHETRLREVFDQVVDLELAIV